MNYAPFIVAMRIYFTMAILFLYSFGYSQDDIDTYEIISTVIIHNNPAIPLVDTLAPTSIRSKLLMDQIDEKINATWRQKRLLKATNTATGISIDRSKLTNFKFYRKDSILSAFKKLDSISLKYIESKKPFYFISSPIIFHSRNIAIVEMDLIGGFGAIYILEKKNGKWIVVDSIGKWYA